MNKERHVFVVEDDISILTGLEANLRGEGYRVSTSMNGTEGLSFLLKNEYDLAMLDIMLPGMNGFEILKKVRKEKPDLPIIMLTARGEEMDKIAGLDYGADDYITKPFSLSELLARVRAVLRRAYSETSQIESYSFASIHIYFKSMQAFKNNKEFKLTRKEYAILQYLIQHEGDVVHRHDLLNEVWGYDKIPSTRTVDNFILEIRKKIEEIPSEPKHILSVSGVGYRFIS